MRDALERVNQNPLEQVASAFEQQDDAQQEFTLLERPIELEPIFLFNNIGLGRGT